ncbi:hypothetical protein OAH18_02720 [bacterium]|nr:hypothetical protein [bacterium]
MDEFKTALIAFTDDIESLMAKHPGCEDTMVRDRICAVLQKSLLSGNAQQRPYWWCGTFNPIAEFRIRRALSRFLRDPAVSGFIAQYNEMERLKHIRELMGNGAAVSRSGETLDYHLGEWA